MLADEFTTPKTLPPGFSFIEKEPEFDASRHLALTTPDHIMTLKDFGYSAKEAAQFASPIGATSATRLLSDEGIATAKEVMELLRPRMVTHDDTTGAAGRQNIYFGGYHSRFLRDLATCPEVISFLSKTFQTPIAPHTMAHLGCQINFGNEKVGKPIAGWHHDIVGFTVVLNLHDPSQLDGGHLVYFKGPRDEGQQILDAGQPLPDDRLVVAGQASIGHATIMQGSAVLHSVQPMRRAGFRCSVINAYVSRDVTVPDPNRGYLLQDYFPGLSMNPVYCEMARHAAWMGRAKLGTILESMNWTEDREQAIAELSAAVEDVERCIQQLRRGDVSSEQYDREFIEEDIRQMTTPLFYPDSTSTGDER